MSQHAQNRLRPVAASVQVHGSHSCSSFCAHSCSVCRSFCFRFVISHNHTAKVHTYNSYRIVWPCGDSMLDPQSFQPCVAIVSRYRRPRSTASGTLLIARHYLLCAFASADRFGEELIDLRCVEQIACASQVLSLAPQCFHYVLFDVCLFTFHCIRLCSV